MDHSIKINKDKILEFYLPIKQGLIKELGEIEIFINDISEDDKEIKIQAEYNIEQKKYSFTKNYKKETLNPFELLFIGWSYLVVYNKSQFNEKNEEFKNKVKEFLILSIRKGIKSCFPHYLLAAYPISYKEGFNTLEDLYFTLIFCNDHFPNFYSLLYIEDKNKIRALGALKEGLKKFPASLILNYHFSNYLIKENNFEKALESINNVNISEYKSEYNYYGFRFLGDLFYNKFLCHVKLKDFENAEKVIDCKDAFSKNNILLLRGLLYYYQSNFETASDLFLLNIQRDLSNTNEYCSYYFLLDCYLKLQKYDLLNDILIVIPDEQIDYIDYGLNIEFLDLAESCLEEITKLDIDEMIVARAKGLLASIILYDRLPKFIDEPKRILTKKEKDYLEKSESLIKDTIDFYPVNQFFLAIYSDILFVKEQYDEAMITKLKSLEGRVYNKYSASYTNVSLENCSEEFIDNYKNKLEKLFLGKNEFRNIYVNQQLLFDIEHLFKFKKYNMITDLYFYFKENLNFKESDYLFEIAYSLKENGLIDDSKFIYCQIINSEPDNSPVLNNLALIFEEKGELAEAKILIKKAKELTKDDKIISNNFDRITGQTKLGKESKKRIKSEKKQNLKLSFDPRKSRIIYGGKFCDIPINTYEYYLCKIIFDKPLGGKIPEDDLLEILDSVKLERTNRVIYDTHLRINKKVEKNIGLKRILINRGSMVWISDDFIM